MKSLNKITAGELEDIFNQFKEKDLVFRCDFAKLAKHLLHEFLPVNPFAVDFPTLTAAYLSNIRFEEEVIREDEHELFRGFRNERRKEILAATTNENDFYRYICKAYFGLVREPHQELLEAYAKTVADLREIDETLADIERQMEVIHKANLSVEIQEKKPVLYYYQQLNETARKELLTFLKHDIRAYALSNCYDNSLMGSLIGQNPYPYSWNPKAYKPRPPNDLANKIGDLPYYEVMERCQQYKDDKAGFSAFLAEYIESKSIVFSLNDLLDRHHILAEQQEVIRECVAMYAHGAKILFSMAVPPIIEGLLHELCLLIGESENELQKEGFQYKLDKLRPKLSWELHYEYYSFRFRLLRNKVSHGRLTKKDADALADLLLLDLYQVCQLVKSDRLDLNHKRFVVDELHKNLAKPDFKYLMEYLLLSQTKIPAFYHLEAQIAEVEKLVDSQQFWDFLEAELDGGGEHVQHGIHFVVKAISKRTPRDKRCKDLFTKLGISKTNLEIASHYLRLLTRDY